MLFTFYMFVFWSRNKTFKWSGQATFHEYTCPVENSPCWSLFCIIPTFCLYCGHKGLSRVFTKPQNMLCYCFQETWHFALVLVTKKSSVYRSQSRIPFRHS